MHPDALRWNGKYRRANGPRRFGVEPRLETVAPLLGAPGRALEVAGGTGGSALWLARAGWYVIFADVSIEALRIARAEAARRALALHAVAADSAALPFAAAGTLDLVLVMRYLDRRLFPWVVSALAPGGQVFYATFNEGHLDGHPRFNRDFVLGRGELDDAFPGFERRAGADEDTFSWILARKPADAG